MAAVERMLHQPGRMCSSLIRTGTRYQSWVDNAPGVAHGLFTPTVHFTNKLKEGRLMKAISCLLGAAMGMTGLVVYMAHAADQAQGEAVPIFGIKVPPGYRDWKLISVAHEAGNLNDLRGVLGNDIAIKAYREGKLPFPDGAIIARLAWSYDSSAENNKVFGRDQSFVAGAPSNVQFMVKDSKKYAATGGWGYAQFKDGKPAEETLLKTCYPCHVPIQSRDFVFTHYSP
jgi:hypothetical protein